MMRVNGSGQGGVAVTPSDTANIAFPSGTNQTLKLHVSVAGSLKVRMASGEDVTFATIGAGIHDLSVVRVFATGTAATGIVALY